MSASLEPPLTGGNTANSSPLRTSLSAPAYSSLIAKRSERPKRRNGGKATTTCSNALAALVGGCRARVASAWPTASRAAPKKRTFTTTAFEGATDMFTRFRSSCHYDHCPWQSHELEHAPHIPEQSGTTCRSAGASVPTSIVVRVAPVSRRHQLQSPRL